MRWYLWIECPAKYFPRTKLWPFSLERLRNSGGRLAGVFHDNSGPGAETTERGGYWLLSVATCRLLLHICYLLHTYFKFAICYIHAYVIFPVTILIQSRQSCCNSVQSSIVKFVHNLVQSIQSKHNWGTHIGIVPKTGISWQTTWGSNPTTIAGARLTFKKWVRGSYRSAKSMSLHVHNPLQSRKICFTIGSDCTRIMWFWTIPAFPIENVRKIINPSPIDQSRLQWDYKRMSNPATIHWIGNQILGTCFFFNPDRIGPIIWQSTKNVAIRLEF